MIFDPPTLMVAAGEARYNPMSYHNGSVWPPDNALVAALLTRHEHDVEVAVLRREGDIGVAVAK